MSILVPCINFARGENFYQKNSPLRWHCRVFGNANITFNYCLSNATFACSTSFWLPVSPSTVRLNNYYEILKDFTYKTLTISLVYVAEAVLLNNSIRCVTPCRFFDDFTNLTTFATIHVTQQKRPLKNEIGIQCGGIYLSMHISVNLTSDASLTSNFMVSVSDLTLGNIAVS